MPNCFSRRLPSFWNCSVFLLNLVYVVYSINIINDTNPTINITTNGSLYDHIASVESNSSFSGLLSGVITPVIVSDGRSRQNKNESWPCKNQCRYTDQNLEDCWKHSLRYHASELLKKSRELYSALLHVDNWKRFHLESNDHDLKNQKFEMETLLEVLSLSDNNDPNNLDAKVNGTLQKIFELIFEEFRSKRDRFHASESGDHEADIPPLPSLSCPVTCDYYPKMWVTLAAILTLTLVLSILGILLYLFCDSWSPRYRGKWRLVYS